jgi:flagellar assembly protein FliH
MSAPHKFLFDQSFDLPDAPRKGAARKAPPPPPEPTYSKAELKAAHDAGVASGREAALAEAAQSTEAHAATSLSTLVAGVATVLAARQSAIDEAQRQACEAMGILLRKMAPALSRKAPLIEIDALIAECLREAFDEPRIVLRVADGEFEAVQQRLGAITESVGYAGKVVLLADEALCPGDARVEWAEGGAERNHRRLMQDFDGALARALDAIPVPGKSPPEENGHG